MTGYQAQPNGIFEKVAKKSGSGRRFFCCFPLTWYRMPSRLDPPGLARLKVARRDSRHSDRPQAFKGNIGLSGPAPSQDRLSSWEGRGPNSRMVGGARYRRASDRRRPPEPSALRKPKTFRNRDGGYAGVGDRIATRANGHRRMPARIKASSRWGLQGSEASTARAPLPGGAPGASRSKGLGAPRPIRGSGVSGVQG